MYVANNCKLRYNHVMLEHAPLPLHNASVWDSDAALRARAPWRLCLVHGARDVIIIMVALLSLIFTGRHLHGFLGSLLSLIELAAIFVCTAPPVARRRWLADGARQTRDFLLSIAPPPRMPTAGCGWDWARLASSCSMHSTLTLAVATAVPRRIVAHLLAALGAVTATGHPRLATSLVACSPRFARG